MQSFLYNAILFQQQRDTYMQKYNEIQEAKKAEKVRIQEEHKSKMYNVVPLTDQELETFGLTLDDDYSKIPKEDIDNFNQGRGIPGALYRRSYEEYFDAEDIKNHVQKQYSEEERTRKKSKKHSQNDPGYNCKTQYYDCVKKIKEFKFDIYGIDKKLKNYKNRGVSACCGGTDVFIFYCGKNNYRFEVRFADDCDCYPGILSVSSVTDLNTNEKIDARCDLYCQNTSNNELDNFLHLISRASLNDYFNKRFSHFLNLPKLFEEHGFKINNMDLINKLVPMFSINKHDFNFYVEVENDKGSCVIIPYAKDHNLSGYCLYISPTLEQINEANADKSYYYEKKKIDINVFNHDMKQKSYKLDYESDDDFNELLKCINAYINKQNGEYGIYDNNVWRNDTEIREYLNKLKKVSFTTFINNYTGPDFDVLVKCNFSDFWVAYSNSRLNDMDFYCDFYGVRFWYDNKLSGKCFLSIQGKYYNVTETSNDYYKDKTVNYAIKDIAEKFIFEGTFDECFENMKYFLEELMKINKLIINEEEKDWKSSTDVVNCNDEIYEGW